MVYSMNMKKLNPCDILSIIKRNEGRPFCCIFCSHANEEVAVLLIFFFFICTLYFSVCVLGEGGGSLPLLLLWSPWKNGCLCNDCGLCYCQPLGIILISSVLTFDHECQKVENVFTVVSIDKTLNHTATHTHTGCMWGTRRDLLNIFPTKISN